MRVVVGAWSKGVKDALTPDVRDARRNLLYDTTVDNMADPSIFVTYHDAQAYPEYRIRFTQSNPAQGHPQAGQKRPAGYKPNLLEGVEDVKPRAPSIDRNHHNNNNNRSGWRGPVPQPSAVAQRQQGHGPDSRGRRAGRSDDRERPGGSSRYGRRPGRFPAQFGCDRQRSAVVLRATVQCSIPFHPAFTLLSGYQPPDVATSFSLMRREAAAALEARERLARTLLLVVQVRPAVRRLAVDALDFVASAGPRDVGRERPLADAPVLHRTESPLAVALHVIVAPVRLARHLAEVAAVDAVHLDADMMRARVVDAVSARALSGEPSQRHARAAALLQRRTVDVQVAVRPRVVVVLRVHVEAAALRRNAQCEQDEGF